jgi:hypothetical protein
MAMDAGKLPPVRIPSTPSTTPTKATETASPVEKTSNAPARPASEFGSKPFEEGEALVRDGNRADTAHAPATDMGWGVSEPVRFTGAKDVKAGIALFNESIATLQRAAATIRAGGDPAAQLKTGGDRAGELVNQLFGFFGKNSILAAGDTPKIKELADTAKSLAEVADAAEKGVLTAKAERYIAGGAVQMNGEQVRQWNESILSQDLVAKADQLKKTVFSEYFNQHMVLRPGTPEDAAERAAAAAKAFNDNRPVSVASLLRNVAQNAARRVEVTEAQAAPVRTNEEITKASIADGEKNGYKADTLAAKIGYALQNVANHEEIHQFSGHLIKLALADVNSAEYKDAGARIDRARDIAGGFVNHYGRNERDMDKVWYAALDDQAKALKG